MTGSAAIKTLVCLLASYCLLSCKMSIPESPATSLMIEHIPDYSLDYDISSATPEHYRVNMYDALTGKLVYQDFVPDGGGMVRSRVGDYLCFLCNFDEGSLILSGEGELGTIHITGPDAGKDVYRTFSTCRNLNGESHSGQRVISLSECFWAGHTAVSVPALSEKDEIFTIKVNTYPVMKQGYVTLSNLSGEENISNIQCFVTNLCGGINPITGETDAEDVIEAFSVECKDGKASGPFLYFGAGGVGRPHLLYALVTDTGGDSYLYVYDLGPMDDGRGLEFQIDSGINVPEPETGGEGGFCPCLGEWDVEYVEVPMG